MFRTWLIESKASASTLAEKILDRNYELPAEKDSESTRDIQVMPWKFKHNGQDYRVNIWDFGGQAIYHLTHQFFLTKRSVYALVADSRKEDTDFNYWMHVQELLADAIIDVVEPSS